MSNITSHGSTANQAGVQTIHGNVYYGTYHPREGATSDQGPTTPRPQCSQSLLPYSRNFRFVGRKNELARLEDYFYNFGQHQRKAALYGLSGVGKTQIAIEFAYRYLADYPNHLVLWIHANTEGRFRQSFAEVARLCNISSLDQDSSDVLRKTASWLKSKESPPWLMVVDSADDADVFFRSSTRLVQNIVDCAHGAILVTTRDKKVAVRLASSAHSVKVETMSYQESADLVFSFLSQFERDNETERDVEALSSHLGCLPLALAQAAAYIQENCMQLQNYVKLCEAGADTATYLLNVEFEASGRKPSESEIPNAVAASMILSLDYIKRENSRAAEIFSLMAFLDRDPVPEDLLLQPGELSSSRQFIEAIGRLQAFSLISKTITGDGFEMHTLVQMITYQWLFTNKVFIKTAAKALRTLCDAFPENPDKIDRIKLDKYLPHGRKYLFDHVTSNRKITKPLFLLTRKVAEHLRYQGREIIAMTARAAALRMAKQLFNPGSYELLRAAFCLAEAFKGLRRYKRAKRLCFHIIRTSEKLELKNRTYINTLTLLGQIYTDQHKSKSAEHYNKCAKQHSVNYLGETDRDTIAIDFQTAAILRVQNEFEAAEKLLREAVKKLENLSEHEYLLGLQHLARVVADQGRHKDSEKINASIVDLKTRSLGANHVETLQAARNLAICYIEQERFEYAENMVLNLLKRCKAVLGENHPDSLRTMQTLADVYFYQSRLEDAEALQQEIYPQMLHIFGEEHAETLDHMMHTARTYASLDRLKEAGDLQFKVLELSRKTLGDKHLSTAVIKSALATTYFDQDTKYIEEEARISPNDFNGGNKRDSALSVLANRSEEKEDHVQSRHIKGSTADKRGRRSYGNKLEDAVTLMFEVLETRRKKCGDQHPDTLIAMYKLGVTLKEMKRTKVAMQLLRECVESSEQKLGMDHPVTKQRRNSLDTVLSLMFTPSAPIQRGVQTVEHLRLEQHLTYETPRSSPPKVGPMSPGAQSSSKESLAAASSPPRYGKERLVLDDRNTKSTPGSGRDRTRKRGRLKETQFRQKKGVSQEFQRETTHEVPC